MVDNPTFYSVRKEFILETWFQEEVHGLLSLDTESVIFSQRTGKSLLSIVAEWVVLSVKGTRKILLEYVRHQGKRHWEDLVCIPTGWLSSV